MKKLLALALVLVSVACTKAAWTPIVDESGVVCEYVIQVIDPAVSPIAAPFCTSGQELAAALVALLSAHTKEALAIGSMPPPPSPLEVKKKILEMRAAKK